MERLYRSHRYTFIFSQKNDVFWGEKKHVFLEGQPAPDATTSVEESLEKPAKESDTPTENKDAIEGSEANPSNTIKDTRKNIHKSVFNGPIPGTPFFNEKSTVVDNALGIALVAPLLVKAGQVGVNSVAKAAQTTWNYGGKQVAGGAWKRAIGTPKSREEGAYGVLGNIGYRLGVENVKRTWFAGLQTIHGVRSALTGSLAGAVSLSRVLPSSLGVLQKVTTKPLAGLLHRVPGINKINIFNPINSIVDWTRSKLDVPGKFAWEFSKADGKNFIGDAAGLINNMKGAALSIAETPLRAGTAAVGPQTDVSWGGAVSNAADAVQDSTIVTDALLSRKKNMGDLRA